MTGLEVIDLSDNKIEESIPDIFSSLESLKEFDVERNLLQGNPFTDVVNAASLESFKISSNFLSGTIPADISKLSGLTTLWMAENRFEGNLPVEMGDLTNLGTYIKCLHSKYIVAGVIARIEC